MKRAVITSLVVLGVLVALVVILVMTPIGWRIATGLIEGAVERRAGLDLTIGSLRGNLLSEITIADARLGVPGGPTILRAGKIEGGYDLPALISRHVVIPKLRVSNAELLFELGADGRLVGWSQFATAPADTAPTAEPPSIDVGLELVDWTVVVRDTAAGYEVRASDLHVRASGGVEDFWTSVEGSLSVASSALTRPIEGTFSSEIERRAGSVRVMRLDVPTDAGDVAIRGVVSLGGPTPALDFAVESALDIGTVSSLLRRSGVGGQAGSAAVVEDGIGTSAVVQGAVEITASVEGPVDSIRYRAHIVGTNLVVRGIDVPRASLDVSGDLKGGDVERFAASVLGGEVTGSATADLTGLRDDPRRVPYDVSLSLDHLDLARLEPLLPEGSAGFGGILSGSARLDKASPGLRGLTGSFDLVIAGFGVGDASLGELVVDGEVDGGTLKAVGRCCASLVTVEAPLEEGIGEIAFTARLSDVSVPAGAYGHPEIGGAGTVEGAITLSPDGFALAADAILPTLAYKELQIGPASVAVTRRDTLYAADFRAFGDVLEGEGSLDTAGRYEVSARVDSFDLAAVMDDTLRERLGFEGAVTAAVSISGRGQDPPAVEGTVVDLFASARGERAYLATPFQFEAAPDTVHITWAAIDGSFGSISVTGGMSVRESGEILARLEGIDLAALANVVPDGLPAPLRGIVDGDVRLVGRRDRPGFVADVGLADFAFGDLELRTVALDALNESNEIIFDLRAESAVAGSVMAYGSIPVVPDSLRFMLPDRTREFGASVVFTDFTLDAGTSLLPNIRGTKRFSADGAVLLVGRGDSLGSLHGRGSFGAVSATFDLVDFRLAEPLEFEIAGGDIEIFETALEVTRRRTLGDAAGGTATVGGVVHPDGRMDVSIRTQALDVGQLVRAFGPEPRATIAGSLDVEAAVTGTFEAPVVDFTWHLARPSFYDVGFESSSGSGRVADDVVELTEANLASGGRSISASGRIPIRPPDADAAEASPGHELDLRISADDFRLDGLTKLPAGLDALEGRLFCDLSIRGALDAPLAAGTVVLREGSVAGFDLAEPIRDIEFEVRAEGGTIVLDEAGAGLGDGEVAASGFLVIGSGAGPVFWVRSELEAPEVKIEDSLDARLGGSLTWAGEPRGSELSGRVVIEKLDVTYPIGLIDLLSRRPVAVVVRRPNDSLARVALDVDIEVEDEIRVQNSLANLTLMGGFHLDGTMLTPEIAGGLYADGGSFKYLDNEFQIETLDVVYVDPKRRDPHVHLLGTANVTDRSEEEYTVTVLFEGFAFETLPQLTSSPSLTQGDIIALLTFGDTFGGLVAGESVAGSSGDRFHQLVRGAFVSSLFGVAESTLERVLRLDTVSVQGQADEEGDLVGADVTVGKVFADRLRVNYTTAVGEFGEQEVEVAFRLSKRISIETRADPEGNHAIGLRLRIPFR